MSAATPRRFRRRLLWALLLGALIPVLTVGVLSARVVDQVLTLSLAPVEQVLDEADATLASAGLAPTQRLGEARLLVAQAELAREAVQRLTWGGFLAVVAIAALAAASAAVLLGRAFARPVESLSSAMARVAAGDLEVRVPPLPEPERDELAFMVQQFNRMTGQLLEQRERLEVTQRLAAWQDVARAMAHELKNPLTAMKMALARIARVDPGGAGDENRSRLTESVSLLEDQLDALMRMTQSFSEFARLPEAAPSRIELRALLNDVAGLYAEARPDLRFEVLPGSEVTLRADPDLLRRAVSNLVKNAAEASPPGAGPIQLGLEERAGEVELSIRDHGAGVSGPVAMGRFVEGLSQKPGGSGLGLPITQKIVHQHGGTLAIQPVESGGTRAMIRLPRGPA